MCAQPWECLCPGNGPGAGQPQPPAGKELLRPPPLAFLGSFPAAQAVFAALFAQGGLECPSLGVPKEFLEVALGAQGWAKVSSGTADPGVVFQPE